MVRCEVNWDTGEVRAPGGILGGRGPRLMFLPILGYEDGYGFSYGVQFAIPNPAGSRSRLAFPLTWGGEKLAGVELEKNLERGPFTRITGAVSLSRRENPFFEENDDRGGVWVEGEHRFARSLSASIATGWQRSSFAGQHRGVRDTGRRRRARYPSRSVSLTQRRVRRGGVGASRVRCGSANRTSLEAPGHLGLVGQSLLVVRALREDSDRPLPANFKPLLGGMSNLRGFEAGHAIGDTLVAGSAELRMPLTSPLNVGKLGVSAFVDVGTVYDKGAAVGRSALRARRRWRRVDHRRGHSIGPLRRPEALAPPRAVHFGAGVTF